MIMECAKVVVLDPKQKCGSPPHSLALDTLGHIHWPAIF
jgi:hypothetical protein